MMCDECPRVWQESTRVSEDAGPVLKGNALYLFPYCLLSVVLVCAAT